MKWIYSLLFFIYGASAQGVETVQPGAVQKFFELRCYKHAKQGEAYDKLVALSYDFYKYAEYTATFLPQHVEHFCKNERPILNLKLKDVNKQMLECLPKEEKFLPQYVQDTFADFLQFICDKDGANVKTFFSSHGKECRNTLSRNNGSQEIGICFARGFTAVGDKGYVSKDSICRDVGLVKGCFNGVLDKYCQGFRAFKELNEQFFKHINKPCSACLFGINNIVTLLCVLVALFHSKLI